jgi:hypothetical protein
MISYRTEGMARIDGQRVFRQMLAKLDARLYQMRSVPIQAPTGT